jgi:hypothetical protein
MTLRASISSKIKGIREFVAQKKIITETQKTGWTSRKSFSVIKERRRKGEINSLVFMKLITTQMARSILVLQTLTPTMTGEIN